jgi:hypothetical protein
MDMLTAYGKPKPKPNQSSDSMSFATAHSSVLSTISRKMKFILPVLALMIGFGTGWYFSGKRIQGNVKAVMPDGMHETFDAFAEYLGPMSPEEVNESMDLIRNFTSQVVVEMHHETLWDGMNAITYKSLIEEEGSEAAISWANKQLERFYEQYEYGMELGESQKMADALYTRTKTEEIQTQ